MRGRGPRPDSASAAGGGWRSRLTGRTAIGVMAAVVGLAIGGNSGQGAADEAKQRAQADAQLQIANIRSETVTEINDARTQAARDQSVAIKAAVKVAVAQAVEKERARADKLVKAAKAEAKKAAGAAPKPQTLTASTDPQFRTCGEANANGYGNYRSGVDPEYDWYQDRDHDGVVCE